MKILIGYPPNYEIIKKFFPVDQHRNVAMCYGDTIYNPFGYDLRRDLVEHESVHAKQQASDPDGWWDRYIADPEFRILQEAEAYGVQIGFIKKHMDETKAERALSSFARFLSSEVYGSVINRSKAREMITRFIK